jgi:hypothetical protein
MNFLWKWGSKPEKSNEDILKDYPALVYYYELISGSRQAWTGQDFESQVYTKFQKKYPLTSENLPYLLSKIFKKVGQPPRAFAKDLSLSNNPTPKTKSWIFSNEENDIGDMREFHEKIFMFLDQMKSINRVLERRICVFANRKSELIRQALPGILTLQNETNRIRRLIVKMKIINLARTKRTQLKTVVIREKFLKKSRLQGYLAKLRGKVMNNLFVLNTEKLQSDPIEGMQQMIQQIHANGAFASKFVLDREKRRLKTILLGLWSREILREDSKITNKMLNILRIVTQDAFLGSLEEMITEMLGFSLGSVISENLHRTIFIDESSNSKISQELKDTMKLDILIPLMNAHNICRFFKTFFKDCVKLFQSLDNFLNVVLVKQFKNDPSQGQETELKEKEFYKNLWEGIMRKKKLLIEDTSRILRKMFILVNQDEIGELSVESIISLLKSYEKFLGSLQIFSFHFPEVPNEQLNNQILLPYVEKSKQKSIRTCFHEILDENWCALSFQPQHIVKRIDKFLNSVKDADFQTTKLTPEEIHQFANDRLGFVSNYTFKGPSKEFTSQKKYNKWLHSPNQLSATPLSKSLAGIPSTSHNFRESSHLPFGHHDSDHSNRLLQNGQGLP